MSYFNQIITKIKKLLRNTERGTPPPSDHDENDDDEEEAERLAMETNPSPTPKRQRKSSASRGRFFFQAEVLTFRIVCLSSFGTFDKILAKSV